MSDNNLGLKAKNTLVEFVQEIDPRLTDFWHSEISKNFGFNTRQKELVKKVLLHSSEHNQRSAKRLRASFVYYSYLLGNQEVTDSLWKASMSVELVHTALLMHDDFMDEDILRRGKPTSHEYFADGNKHHGESMAVCAGDAILCLGYELLLESGFSPEKVAPALSQFLRGTTNTAYGQAYDALLQHQGNWTEDDVISLHRAKTAIYTYENPLLIGSILSGLSPAAIAILHTYSMDGGVAFQLQDDLLGVFGDEEKTGKSANSDLLQGKCTILILKALELGTTSQVKLIKQVWGNKLASPSQIELAKKAIIESGSYLYNKNLAISLAKKAAATASKLRSLHLNPTAINYIQGIAEYMVDREV